MVIRDYSERIKLCLITDKAFKSNFLAVDLIMPLDKENVTENAVLPNVLLRGTAGSPDMLSLNRRLNMLYGASLDAETVKKNDSLVMSFSIRFLKDRFAFEGDKITGNAMKLLFETITSPAFTDGVFNAAYVESEIKNQRDRIDAEINNKRSYAVMKCIAETCPDEPFGISANGSREQLEKITSESLVKRWKAVLSSSKIFAFFFGECDESLLCEQLFSAFDKSAPFIPIMTSAKAPTNNVPKRLREEMPVTQAKLAIAFRAGALDRYNPAELALFNAIYGSGATSKLFENVREKMSLCYYCASRVYRQKGIMTVDSGVEAKNADKAYDEILSQLSDVASKLITEREFSSAEKAMRNAYSSLKDSFSSLHDWYLSCSLAGEIFTPDEMIDLVTAADIGRVSEIAGLFRPETVFLLAPKEAVK